MMEHEAGHLERVLAGRSLTPLFQPVVDLASGQMVGYEALSRGPDGPLFAPEDLFGEARRQGRLHELDWLCREIATDTARRAGFAPPLSLLVNAEPEVLLAGRADAERWAQFGDLRCYAELTERALCDAPGRLLAAVEQVRAQDWGVALDDVGVEPSTLALLPLLQPDLIKLDRSLLDVDRESDVGTVRVVHAVFSEAARTGATVIAEGIETERQLDLARALGADYGQGFLLGRPEPLPQPLPMPREPMPLLGPFPHPDDADAHGTLADAVGTRAVSGTTMVEVARQLLVHATELEPPPVVLVSGSPPLPAELQQLLTRLDDLPLLAIVGRGTASTTGDGDAHPAELTLTVTTAHFAAALSGRPQADSAGGAGNAGRAGGAEGAGTIATALTFDRTLALATAVNLLARL